jgi:membrane protease YdiL (CAAX protease family)
MCSHPAITYAAETGNRKGDVKTMYGSTNSEGGSMKTSAEGQIARGGAERESTAQGPPSESQSEQYSLAKVLGIWALAAAPMGILNWIVFPLLAPGFESDPFRFAITLVVLITLGLVWLFVLSMIIVRREEGDLRWATVKRRLRLNAPREPATGEPRARLWLWVVPFIVAVTVVELVLNTPLENAWVSVFPFLAEPHGYSFDAILGSQEILARLVGAWWFFALVVVMSVFNTILGEEFLFRGVLLPKMEGVFGRGSWVANSVLFALYHVHKPWVIPNAVLTGLLYTFPAYRYRSTWMSIIVHSAQSVYFAFLVLGVVLGLA